MTLLVAILSFLAGLWLGRRTAPARPGRRQTANQWLAHGQGTGIHVPPQPGAHARERGGRIYLRSPP